MFWRREKTVKKCSEKDFEFLSLLCLGRPPLHDGERRKKIGRPFFGVAKGMFASPEFAREILEPLTLGRLPAYRPYSIEDQKLIEWGLDLYFRTRIEKPIESWLSALTVTMSEGRLLQMFEAAQTGYSPVWLKEQIETLGDPPAPRLLGQVEEATSNTIRGYAFNPDAPTIPLVLDIYVNDAFVGQVSPTSVRRELQELYGGDGLFVFQHSYQIPTHLNTHDLLVARMFDSDTGRPIGMVKEFAPIRARHKSAIAYLANELKALRSDLNANNADYTPLLAHLKKIEDALPDIRETASIQLDEYPENRDRFLVNGEAPPSQTRVAAHALFGSDAPSAENLPDADWLIYLPTGAELLPGAEEYFAHHASSAGDAVILYCDYELISDTSLAPIFRTKFDPYTFLAAADSPAAFAVKREWFISARESAADAFSLWLEALKEGGPNTLLHIPELLYRTEARAVANEQSLKGYLDACAPGAELVKTRNKFSGEQTAPYSIRWPAKEPAAKLAVIIPSRDNLDLLRPGIESLNATIACPEQTEILIMDNGSTEENTLAWLAEVSQKGSARIIQHDEAFNWSELNNIGVANTDADYLLFLNDDTKALETGWDKTLRGYLARPDIGVVGARLLYEDGNIQHAGVIINQLDHVASDAIIHEGADQSPALGGYLGRTATPHLCSAVTGAFLACRREEFIKVGGFDADQFAVAFNDIDFCLKLRDEGLGVLYAPEITFFHYESKSRGYDSQTPEKAARVKKEHEAMIAKWSNKFRGDPWYPKAFLRSGRAFEKLAP